MDSLQFDTIIIGAGAAGFFAAMTAGHRQKKVLLLEKGPKTGVKILMSGGTRCNITQDTDTRGIVEAFGRNGKFLNSALAKLNPQDVVHWFRENGVATKREPSGKIFPVSDRAVDVRNALLRQVEDLENVTVKTHAAVTRISHDDSLFEVDTAADRFRAASVVITTGGKSYPDCGTNGDGYQWARQFGHTITETFPALTPIVCPEAWVKSLKGITVLDVLLGAFENHDLHRISDKNFQKLAKSADRNSLLFTHFGLSGPAALNVSKAISAGICQSPKIVADFLPDISIDKVVSEFSASDSQRRSPKSILQNWVPSRLSQTICEICQITDGQNMAECSKIQRQNLVKRLKRCEIAVEGTRGYKKAEVTSGGVSLKEVNSQTMESKLVNGLFFAGEVLDLDGPIGGYNFQSAFSTGHLAGLNV